MRRSRGLGDVYKRQVPGRVLGPLSPEALSDTVEGSFAVDDFSKSDIAGRVQIGVPFPQQLAHRVQAALDDYTKNQMLGDPGRPRGVLFITDRTMDLVSPFLHEFTYQAMVYDLVPIQDNTYKHTCLLYTSDAADEATIV